MTEPTSPFSGKPWSECDDRERDAWVYTLLFPDARLSQTGEGEYLEGDSLDEFRFTIPHYTQGEYLNELLESELWPIDALIRKTPDGWTVCDGYIECGESLALVVCEVIVRNAWEKANDADA